MSPARKYNCIIVDDEPPARIVLRRYVEQIPMLQLTGECNNAVQALHLLQQQHVDLLLLDIRMPQIGGMELIKTLKKPPKIILTTAFEQYAVQAFELDVTDYLVKPIQFERFVKAVMKALPSNEQSTIPSPVTTPAIPVTTSFLYFRADRKMVKVFLDEILFIESLKDYQKIYTTRGDIMVKLTLLAIEAMLPANLFLRVHRSFMVCVNKIDAFTPEQLNIRQHYIPIGKLYRQQVLNILNTVAR